jgi:GAF domain-containing protein/anti-sigma regulatory factor (Ser/Thr protein kinase)
VETGFTTRSLLCVPLHLNGQALGVLQALNKKSLDGFDSADIARLSAFATWATVAIQNARLFQEASQARQLSALNELALALGSTLDVDTVLNIGLSRAVNLLRADAGAINLDGDESTINRFSTLVTQGFSGPPPTQAVARLSAQILAGDKSDALIVDKSRPTNLPEARALLAETGTHALALIPLPISYGVQGTLVVLNRHPHHYTPDESNLLISITRIIGLAVQNALHYSQMRAQAMHLTYLNDVGSALISSLNLAHVLRVIIQGVNAMLETERTSVFLIDSQTNELVLRYSNEGDANIRLPAPWQGIAGWVATHDKPTLVNDTLSDPRHLRQVALDTGYEAQSILCVPLKVEGEVIGVVEVLNKTGGQQFTHYHQVLLVEFTRWAAIAIHNARLFDERGRAYQHLAAEQERRIAAETRGAMAAVILDMAHTMNNIVGAIRVWATNLEQAAQAKPESTLAAFKKEVGRIRRNAEEAIRLIGTMTGPLEQPALAPTNVNTCLAAAIESCWWPDNVSLAREDAATLPPVKANAKRLEAVFHNLLSNAVQVLAPYGGQVRVCTRLTPAGAVEIAIADNGPGIPPGLQNQLFTPGVSGTDGGLGIGLWLVETFVHQFEGRINFTTSDTQGTTFFVTLLPAE